jgi:hypothetical protein
VSPKLLVGGLTVAVAFLLATNPVVVDAAGQITGGQVRDNSITGKDVREKSLKGVNAKKLSGKKSKAYTNPTYRYQLPVQPAAQFRTYTFPGLPNGTYLATINATFSVAAVGKAVLCRFDLSGSHELLSYGAPAQFDSFSTVSSAGVVQVTGVPSMLCTSQSTPPDDWAVYNPGNRPSIVTFTRVDSTKFGTPTVSRTVERHAETRN